MYGISERRAAVCLRLGARTDRGDTLKLGCCTCMLHSASALFSCCGMARVVDWAVSSKYRLSRWIGKGAFGQVMLAEDLGTGRSVAIKRVSASNGHNCEQNLLRLLREISLLRRLDHPNVIKILDVLPLSTDGSRSMSAAPEHIFDCYIVMEYGGCTLLQYMSDRTRTLGHRAVYSIMTQLLSAVAYIHSCGIVHRDIKPDNILIDMQPDGSPLVRLADFGLARVVDFEVAGDFTAGSPRLQPQPSPRSSNDRAPCDDASAAASHSPPVAYSPPVAGAALKRVADAIDQTVSQLLHAAECSSKAPKRASEVNDEDGKLIYDDLDVSDAVDEGSRFSCSSCSGMRSTTPSQSHKHRESDRALLRTGSGASVSSTSSSAVAAGSSQGTGPQKHALLKRSDRSSGSSAPSLLTGSTVEICAGDGRTAPAFSRGPASKLPPDASPAGISSRISERSSTAASSNVEPAESDAKSASASQGRPSISASLGRPRKMTSHVVTRWYRAPEVFLTQGEYSFGVDIWSCGCVFAELLSLMSELTIRKRRSTVLFEGSKFILGSPLGADVSARAQRQPDLRDMFRLIFRLLGVPDLAELADITHNCSGVLQVLLQSYAQGEDAAQEGDASVSARLQRRLDAADQDDLRLLRLMLGFHPRNRPSALELLSEPSFAAGSAAAASSLQDAADVCSAALWPEISALNLEYLVEGTSPKQQYSQKLLKEVEAFAMPRGSVAGASATGCADSNAEPASASAVAAADRAPLRRRKGVKSHVSPVSPAIDSPGLTALVHANTKRMRQLRLDSVMKGPGLLSPESAGAAVATPLAVPAKKARGGATPAGNL